MDNKIAFQLGDGAFWLSLAVGLLGLLIIAGVVAFAVRLKKQDELLLHKMCSSTSPERQLTTFYLENRIEFWIAYGQIILAILLIVALTILLLTKTISAEAGLPILSAIAGFAIAKGAGAARLGTTTARETPPSSQAGSLAPQKVDSPKSPEEQVSPPNPPDNPGQSPTPNAEKTPPTITKTENEIFFPGGPRLDVHG